MALDNKSFVKNQKKKDSILSDEVKSTAELKNELLPDNPNQPPVKNTEEQLKDHAKQLKKLNMLTTTVLVAVVIGLIGLVLTVFGFAYVSIHEYSQTLSKLNDDRIIKLELKLDKLESKRR